MRKSIFLIHKEGKKNRIKEKKLTGYPSIDKPWLKYYSEEAISAPVPQCTIWENIYNRNHDYPDDIALQYYGRKITYGKMFDNVEVVKRAFVSAGVKRGDNIAFLMLSCPELLYAFLALNQLGACANMINPTFSAEQMRDRINDTEAEIILILDQLYDSLAPVIHEICAKRTIIVPLENAMPFPTKMLAHMKLKKQIPYNEHTITWNYFIRTINKSISNVPDAYEPGTPAVMVYSSGTTGAAKGIVLTNEGINATLRHYASSGFIYNREMKSLQIVPLWFSTGLVFCLLMPLLLGITSILEPVFSAENFAQGIIKHKPQLVLGATSLWLYTLQEIEKRDIDCSFLCYPVTGGEKLLPETEIAINTVLKKRGGGKMLVGYGMCELGSTVTATSMLDTISKEGSAGYPILGVLISSFDPETNEEKKYNERGEIRVLTPARMKGYYKRPDATAEFFVKDSQGREWGCTGDVGYVDEDGFVFIQGRVNDTMTTAPGEKVYCFDIEALILQNRDIDQCKVVGLPAGDGFEKPVAFVVMKGEKRENLLGSIKACCLEKLPKDCIPVAVHVLDAFPIKASGKQDVEKLKEMAIEFDN